MRLMDLQEVVKIDNKINRLHSELVDLYRKRAHYIGIAPLENNQTHTASLAINDEEWVDAQYDKLNLSWINFDINIPSKAVLKRKLIRSRRVINALVSEDPTLNNKLGVLLIPPSNLINFPQHDFLRNRQTFIQRNDYLDDGVKNKYNQRNWRVIVAYMHPEALKMGSADKILSTKSYMFAGFDTRALGVYEHVALSLQQNIPLDHNAWNLLLKGYKKNDKRLIPSVMFFAGQYRFELDEAAGILGLERFRPAVEIVLRNKVA